MSITPILWVSLSSMMAHIMVGLEPSNVVFLGLVSLIDGFRTE